MIQLNSHLWHPCSIDIIEHKVIAIKETNEGIFYETQAISPVGACGRIKTLLCLKQNGTLVFVDLLESYKYSSGLQDFIEGIYYSDKQQARLAYYNMQETTALISMNIKKDIYEHSKSNYEKIKQIIAQIKLDLKETHEN